MVRWKKEDGRMIFPDQFIRIDIRIVYRIGSLHGGAGLPSDPFLDGTRDHPRTDFSQSVQTVIL